MGLYAVLVAAGIAAAFFADWPRIRRIFFQTEIARDMFPEVLTRFAVNTLVYTFAAFVFGLVLALILALMRLSPVGPYRWIATTYVELFRSVPALVTILLVNYGVPLAFGTRIPGGLFGIAAVGLGMVAAAYMAETIRAGIEAVPRGQSEAARSLGMRPSQAMFSIILPQAFRIIIPPLTNEFVLLIKDTSLLFVVGTTPLTRELTKFSRDVMQENSNATPMVIAALIYLVITLPLTFLVRRLEKRGARGR
ncbi:MAG TPA: amino acid ABC transporter permease [Acidimicrobiia bacterium]|jgi:polar amino acid transport system permease protein|nr:amino acid ABC transporter permease [Acidimicrobiia bacterium]